MPNFVFGEGTEATLEPNGHLSFVLTSAVRLGACPGAAPNPPDDRFQDFSVLTTFASAPAVPGTIFRCP